MSRNSENMKPEGTNIASVFSYLAVIVFISLVSLLMLAERVAMLQFVFAILGLGFVIYFLLFKKEFLVCLCFLVVPLSIPLELFGGARISFPSEMLLAVMGAVFLLALTLRPMIDKKVLMHPITLLLFFDVCWMIISSIYSTMPEVSLKRLVIKSGVIIFFYLFCVHWFRQPRKMVYPMLLYAIGTLPVILYSIKEHAAFNFIPQVSVHICQPFYRDHTIYGASLAFIIPFLIIILRNQGKFGFNKYGKWMIGAILITVLVGEGLSFSRASIISLLAALGFYGLLKLHIRMKGLLLLFAIGSVLCITQYENIYSWIGINESLSNKGNITEHFKSIGNFQSDPSNLERLNRWTCAIKMFEDRPITGFGPGTYQFEYGNYQTLDRMTYISTFKGDKGNAHSEYLTNLSETGLPGLLIFLSIVFYIVYIGLRNYYDSTDPVARLLSLAALLGLITFFVHGLVNAFIDQDKMAALVFPAMAVLVALDIYHKKTVIYSPGS